MLKSMLILALICLVVAAGLTFTASAGCATCGAEENWNGLDKLDEIGNTAAEQQSPQIYNPAAARVTNSQFERQNGSSNSSAQANSAAQTPTLNVDLEHIEADPNPASPGTPVKITAVLGAVENMTAYAIIKDSNGVKVGNVTLDKTPGGEYVGNWNAGIATGVYNVTVVATSEGKSKTFDDALQIEVKESDSAASNNGKASTYTRLG